MPFIKTALTRQPTYAARLSALAIESGVTTGWTPFHGGRKFTTFLPGRVGIGAYSAVDNSFSIGRDSRVQNSASAFGIVLIDATTAFSGASATRLIATRGTTEGDANRRGWELSADGGTNQDWQLQAFSSGGRSNVVIFSSSTQPVAGDWQLAIVDVSRDASNTYATVYASVNGGAYVSGSGTVTGIAFGDDTGGNNYLEVAGKIAGTATTQTAGVAMAAWGVGASSAALREALRENPWALFERRSIWVPVSAPASGGTGTLSTTLDALTSSATGSLAISGSASVTLGTLTASATGTLAITGTAGVTLDALTSAATGVHDTISGSASITLDALTSSGTGALAISGTLSQTLAALTVSAYENAPAPTPAASSPTPAGRANKRRYVVEIDGETFDVASPTEAVAVLEQARETAKEQAAQAMQRAAKAQKRPVRKVIADARKALPIPQITVPETLKPAAQVVLEQIQTMYAQTMRDIEVAARMAHEQRIRDLEDDDEDVLLLL